MSKNTVRDSDFMKPSFGHVRLSRGVQVRKAARSAAWSDSSAPGATQHQS
jgi:hypothetical protein